MCWLVQMMMEAALYVDFALKKTPWVKKVTSSKTRSVNYLKPQLQQRQLLEMCQYLHCVTKTSHYIVSLHNEWRIVSVVQILIGYKATLTLWCPLLPVPDWVKPSFVIFDIWALWRWQQWASKGKLSLGIACMHLYHCMKTWPKHILYYKT